MESVPFCRKVAMLGRVAAGLGVLGIMASGVHAQTPLIYNRAVYNAASYMPAGIPAGAIARGSIFTFFGSNIGPVQSASANAFPLGTTLGGVSINVVQGSTTVSAIPLFVSASQVNAIMPSNAPLGRASIQVVVGNLKSNLAPLQIVSTGFGTFTALGTGQGPGVLQNFVSATNQPVNSPTVTAQPGQAITLYGTGLGPVTGGDNVAPPAGNLPVQVEVFVGGVSAPVLYSGRAPCCAGLDQIVFTTPTSAPTGCWVPVYVRTAKSTISNFVTIAIQPSGGVCTTDVLPQVTANFIGGKKIGEALAARATTRHDIGVRTPLDVTADYHLSGAFQSAGGPFPFNPALAFPPSGTCTFYTLQGDMLGGAALPGSIPISMPLDFGAPFLLTGPRGSKTLTYTFTGARAGYLGGSISNNILPSSLFLDPGAYTLQGFGGANIGAFSTSFTVPAPLVWTNRDQLGSINRSQPLSLTWTGGDTQAVAIVGFGEDLPTNSSAVFVCLAPMGANGFTVPPDILSNLPATRGNPLQSKDVIYLFTLATSSVQNLGASGLDLGLTSFYSFNGKTVVLQ